MWLTLGKESRKKSVFSKRDMPGFSLSNLENVWYCLSDCQNGSTAFIKQLERLSKESKITPSMSKTKKVSFLMGI
jgi:hypothetical protein